jgi:hypothetical protein
VDENSFSNVLSVYFVYLKVGALGSGHYLWGGGGGGWEMGKIRIENFFESKLSVPPFIKVETFLTSDPQCGLKK